MGFLEETKLFPVLIPLSFDTITTQLIIDFFVRFIDDGFNFLPKSVAPSHFLQILNKMHSSIQYTLTLSTPFDATSQSMNFLSIKVVITADGDVKTDVYYKETNAHDYLHFDSHHLQHTKINIPYVLAKRIYLLTSEEEWIDRNLADLKDFLIARKYPIDVIQKGIHNALLQGPKPQEAKKVIPMITTYLSNYDSDNIISVAKDLISNSRNQRIKNAFQNTKFIKSYKQPQNLLQILSNSRFITSHESERDQKPSGIFHCTHPLCKICLFE